MSAPRAGDANDDPLVDRESPPDERLIEDVKSYEEIGAGRESAEDAEADDAFPSSDPPPAEG